MNNLAFKNDVVVGAQDRTSDVLILDDMDFDRKRLRRNLSKGSIPVNFTEADSLCSFLVQVRSKSFDLILVDYALADGDGLQAIRTCSEWKFNENAYFVMVTGNDSSTLAVDAMKSGFDDYLRKDDVDHDRLSDLLKASAQKKTQRETIVPFPSSITTEVARSHVERMLAASGASLTDMLQQPLADALRSAMTGARIEEFGADAAWMQSTFEQEDEFIFLLPDDETKH